MTDWTLVAERMNLVKHAKEDFLLREVVDDCIIGPMLLDRLAADLMLTGAVYAEGNESAVDGSGCR